MKGTLVSFKADAEVVAKARATCSRNGVDLVDVLRSVLTQIAMTGEAPHPPKPASESPGAAQLDILALHWSDMAVPVLADALLEADPLRGLEGVEPTEETNRAANLMDRLTQLSARLNRPVRTTQEPSDQPGSKE